MNKTLIRALAAATVLISTPAFAQEADHSIHQPDSISPAATSPSTAPAAGTTPALDAPAAATVAPAATPAPPATPGMAGGMECMKMMQGMMGGGMPMMGGQPQGGMQGGMPMTGGQPQGGMAMGAAPAASAGAVDSPSTRAYRIANARMHAGMAIDHSGDADADFVRGMIAHHRGAIEMAETVLEYGKDPGIRKLAEGVIAAQEAEVATLRTWLLDHRGAAR